jgi:zinc transport system substrate-binding protein
MIRPCGLARTRVLWSVIAGALLLTGVTGCREASTAMSASARPLVVASIYPLYEFTRQVAGERADVRSLVPPGTAAHDWEPAPADVGRVEKAALFVYQGAGFDPGAARLARTTRVTLEATAGLPLLAAAASAHGTTARPDPHVWLDPTLAQMQVARIQEALSAVDAANAPHYAQRAAEYTRRLGTLHETYERGLADCARRDIVVSHAAFAYLANRYRLKQIPVTGVAPEAEPSPTEIARVVRAVRRIKANVVFVETLVSPRLAETLAAEVGATTMVLNPVEGLTADEARVGKNYVSLMEDNLRNLRLALECR